MKRYVVICLVATVCAMCGRPALPGATTAPEYASWQLPPDSVAPTPTYFYTEGIKRAEIWGDRKGAAEWFDKAIGADSSHSPSYFAAAGNIAQTDPAKALEYSRAANRLDSANVWYRTQLAGLLTANRRFGEAMRVYETLRGEANPEVYRMLTMLHRATGDPYRALSVLDSAEIRFGRQETFTGMKRELYMELRMFDKAIEANRAMIDEYPYDYKNYLVMGELYRMSGRDSLARANYFKARDMAPGDVDVLMALAGYYRERGDTQDFLATMQPVFRSDAMGVATKVALWDDITRDREFYGRNYLAVSGLARTLMLKYPTDFKVVDLYAGTLFAGGESEQGLNVYKNFITDTTSLVRAYTMVLDGETYFKRADSVELWAARAIARFPDNLDLHLQKGSALAYLDRDDEALATYRAVLKMPAGDSLRSAVHTSIADLYYGQGKVRRSEKEYERALRYDPDNVLALNNYAYHLSLSGHNLDRALEMAQRVMELNPGEATYIDTYGWVLFRMGRLEDAKKALRQAVSLDERASGEVLLHYGDVLDALDETFMAKYYWEKALEAGADKAEVERRLK